MKTLLLLSVLLSAIFQLNAQETITLLDAKNSYSRSPQSVSYDPAKPIQVIVVKFASEADATAALGKLKFTTDASNPAADATLFKSEKDESDKKKLLFKIPKEKFGGQDVIHVAVLLSGTVKAKFDIKKKETGADPSAERFVAVKPDNNVFNALSATYSTNSVNYSTLTVPLSNKDNHLLYNLEDNKIKAQTGFVKKDLKVGSSLLFELNPVPNPEKFDVAIMGDYINRNDSTNKTLDKFLLNPFSGIDEIKAKSGGIAADKRKGIVLGYLQAVNSSLIKFLAHYRSQQFIDPVTFSTDKRALEGNVETVLRGLEGYPGNIPDLIVNEFEPSDTLFINPIMQNYVAVKKFNVNRTYLPIASLGNYDELGITVKLTPKANQQVGVRLDSVVNRVPLNLYGGIKVDVSTGLFYSFIDQPSYSIRKDSTIVKSSKGADSTASRYGSIIKEGGSAGKMGFATMVHFYSRWGTSVNVALSFGAGLTLIDDPQLRYMAGASLLFGRTNRVALTFGYMAGRVKQLSDVYLNEDESFRKVPFADTQLTTKKVTGHGCFLAVSYNFPLLKRKK